jgi:hypothetical protein
MPDCRKIFVRGRLWKERSRGPHIRAAIALACHVWPIQGPKQKSPTAFPAPHGLATRTARRFPSTLFPRPAIPEGLKGRDVIGQGNALVMRFNLIRASPERDASQRSRVVP